MVSDIDRPIRIGMKVRLYDDDDWFFEGEIVEIKDNFLIVDFLDLVKKWLISEMKWIDLCFQKFLVPTTDGTIVLSHT